MKRPKRVHDIRVYPHARDLSDSDPIAGGRIAWMKGGCIARRWISAIATRLAEKLGEFEVTLPGFNTIYVVPTTRLKPGQFRFPKSWPGDFYRYVLVGVSIRELPVRETDASRRTVLGWIERAVLAMCLRHKTPITKARVAADIVRRHGTGTETLVDEHRVRSGIIRAILRVGNEAGESRAIIEYQAKLSTEVLRHEFPLVDPWELGFLTGRISLKGNVIELRRRASLRARQYTSGYPKRVRFRLSIFKSCPQGYSQGIAATAKRD